MNPHESLQDVSIRRRQLEAHILRSPEYLRRADQDLKRQVAILYLAIALLLFFQVFMTVFQSPHFPLSAMVLITVTSFLAILNCLLLIQTKQFLHRLNESWLNSQEKVAIDALESERRDLLSRQPGLSSEVRNAEWN